MYVCLYVRIYLSIYRLPSLSARSGHSLKRVQGAGASEVSQAMAAVCQAVVPSEATAFKAFKGAIWQELW